MKMKAQLVSLLVCLALIKYVICADSPFELANNLLTTTEGSCIEITCRVIKTVNDKDADWFWMKDAQWTESSRDFTGTIIYSTNNLTRPVSPDFAGRVKYVGSSSSSWNGVYEESQRPLCSILICNLKKSDSGQYAFRFIGPYRNIWITKKNVTVTVKENPCPITFETPPPVKENDKITFTCSTLNSCDLALQIEDLSQLPSERLPEIQLRNTTYIYTAKWQDDGKVFSCQTQNNTDQYLIRNISIAVEYAPKEISTRTSSEQVKEGDSVTLTCFAKGHPNATFTWFKNDSDKGSSDNKTASEWTFTSIDRAQHGKYYCEAKNKYGTITSNPVTINVQYAPEVEIKMTSPKSAVREGDEMSLTCHVNRSNPHPHTYTWSKDEVVVGERQTYVKQMNIEDRGNYICTARNDVDVGKSKPLAIEVEYLPRNTNISPSGSTKVKVGESISFTCNADAYPSPSMYSWYCYKNNEHIPCSRWTFNTTNMKFLNLENIQRADEACFMCNATNSIGTGLDSYPVCIQVLYPPSVPILNMKTEVTENQTITIKCTVDSFPSSILTLIKRSTSNSQNSEMLNIKPRDSHQRTSELIHTFKVTSTDAGFYFCNASNSEGSNKSREKTLVVKYTPKVTIQTTTIKQSEIVVNETTLLTLYCIVNSYPQVDSFNWMKDGREFGENGKNQNLTVTSVSPSHSGKYSCAARNKIGIGQSKTFEVKVQYAPKHTKISITTEQQDAHGKSYVKLHCHADSYPSVTQYTWHKKEKDETVAEVNDSQNYTVYSDQPGIYYCVAKNLINKKKSDEINLFDGSLMKILKFVICLVLILLIIIIIVVFVYRYRKKNSIQQGARQSFFLGWSNGTRRVHLTAESFRSRDDLLPERSCRPEASQCQPPPDSTSASGISSVYCMVNHPPKKQAHAAQTPHQRPQGVHTVDDSLNHASLPFGDRKNNKQAKPAEDAVYAKVCRPKPHNKDEQEWQRDYENISATRAANCPNLLDDDTDTDTNSDDDVQLNYTHVTFTANPGNQRANTDTSSTSSEEDDIHYSDIKI